MRARGAQSAHRYKASTLGSDVFLLDIVPPSPYHVSDSTYVRPQSCDRRDSESRDHDAVDRPPPPPGPALVRDRAVAGTPDDSSAPTLPARRPMTPQSPPPPPPPLASASNSLSRRDVYYNGISNAAFTHPAVARVESASTPGSGRITGVYRPASSDRVPPPSPSASGGNSVGRSPVVPRRRDVDVDDDRRSATGARGSRLRDDACVPGHPPPPPPLAAGATGQQNDAATVSDRARLRGPLSLSTGELNVSPPAPHVTSNQVC